MPAGPQFFSACDEKDIPPLIEALFGVFPQWHKMVTGIIQAPENLRSNIEQSLGNACHLVDRNNYRMAEIKDYADFDDYLGTLSSHWRRNYRKASRELLESEQVTIEHVTRFNDMPT